MKLHIHFDICLMPWCCHISCGVLSTLRSAGLPEAESLKGEAVDSSLGCMRSKVGIDQIFEHSQESMENHVTHICIYMHLHVTCLICVVRPISMVDLHTFTI